MATDLPHLRMTNELAARILLEQAGQHAQEQELGLGVILSEIATAAYVAEDVEREYAQALLRYVQDVIDLNDGDGLLESLIYGLACRRR